MILCLLFGLLTPHSQQTKLIMGVSTDQLLQLGLVLKGYTRKQRNRKYTQLLTWFKACYGEHPLVYVVLWHELKEVDGERKLNPYMMTLHWLKCYPTEAELAGDFNLDEKTIRLWTSHYSECIQLLKPAFIVFPTDDEWGETVFGGVVDGTHCRVMKPQHHKYPFDKRYKSHKFGKDAVTYEIMLDMKGIPRWVNGPHPAGKNDKLMYNEQLRQKVPDGKLLIADCGYDGCKKVSTPSNYESEALKEFKRNHRARIEHYNGRLKNFAILDGIFRTKGEKRMEKHKTVFDAINVIVTIAIKTGFPLFDP